MKNKTGLTGLLFITIGLLFFAFSCATAPPAEEKKAEPAQAAPPAAGAPMKWTSAQDGEAKDGVFKRVAAPAFTFDIPSGWEMQPLQGGDVFRGRRMGGLPTCNITVDRIPEGMDPKEYLQGYAKGYAEALSKLGTNVEVLVNKPTDKYSPHPGQQIEIEWAYAGTTFLVSFVYAIVKDGYVIGIGGHTMGDPGEMETIFDSFWLD